MDLVVGRLQTHPGGFGFVDARAPARDGGGDIYIAGTAPQRGDARRPRRRAHRARHGRRPRRGAHHPHPRARQHLARRPLRPRRRRHGLRRAVRPPRADGHRRSAGQEGGASPGDMVIVEITRWPTADARRRSAASPRCSATSTRPASTPRSSSASTAFPTRTRDEAVAEARRLGTAVSRDATSRGRTDFRAVADGHHRRRARARLRRRDHDRAAAERQLLARRAHRRRLALRARRAARSTRRPTSAARRCTFPSAPSTCFRRSSRPASAA